MERKWLRSPDGLVTKKVAGVHLLEKLTRDGWTETEPPEPKKRSRAKRPTHYWSDDAYRNY